MQAKDPSGRSGPTTPALVAQRIEHRPPEPGAQVRVLPRAPAETASELHKVTGGGVAQLDHPEPLLAILCRCDWEERGRRIRFSDCPGRMQRHASSREDRICERSGLVLRERAWLVRLRSAGKNRSRAQLADEGIRAPSALWTKARAE